MVFLGLTQQLLQHLMVLEYCPFFHVKIWKERYSSWSTSLMDEYLETRLRYFHLFLSINTGFGWRILYKFVKNSLMVINPFVKYFPVMLKDFWGIIVVALCILLLEAAWVPWQRMYEVVILYKRRVCWFTVCVRIVWSYNP